MTTLKSDFKRFETSYTYRFANEMGARVDVWMCDRYRTMLQEVDPGGVPPTEYLFIDLDDVISTYVGWSESAVKQTEAALLRSLTKHVAFLVELVQPKTELFVALSGVQPAAFLNAERRQRFYTKGKILDNDFLRSVHAHDPSELFNMNVLTPGTPFMERLDRHMLKFLRENIATDLLWKRLKVTYSGSGIAGDAAFKICEEIRSLRSQRLLEGVLTHGIYSTKHDTPLHVMATREPYIYLIKERTHLKFKPGPSDGELKKENLVIQFMNLFRECWEQEFKELGDELDLERTLDDFVLICSFLGNRALPSIPTLHLLEGSLDELLDCYKEFIAPALDSHSGIPAASDTAPSISPYLTHADRSINLMNLEAYVHLIGTESKELARLRFRKDLQSSPEGAKRPCLISQDAIGMIYYQDRPYEWWKDWYYAMKLRFVQGDKAARKEIAQNYLNGLIWYFEYLTKGISCWDYGYHDHYAPALSDLTVISELSLDFTMGEAMSRLEYLLCVLPVHDAEYLPLSHRIIMTSEESPYADLYNSTRSSLEFSVDMEGSWTDREGKLLIDRFNFYRITKTIGIFKDCQRFIWPDLTLLDDGLVQILVPDPHSQETICGPAGVRYAAGSSVVYARPIRKKGRPSVAGPRMPAPSGFPTLATVLQLKSVMMKIKCDRHGYPTDRKSLVLEVSGETSNWPGGSNKVFKALQEQTVLIGYPRQLPATVIGASDTWNSLFVPSRSQRLIHGGSHVRDYSSLVAETKQRLWVEQGINAGKCGVLLHVIVHGDLNEREIHYPVQLTVMATEAGQSSANECFFQSHTSATVSVAHTYRRTENEGSEMQGSGFGPLPPELSTALPISETLTSIPAMDSSYSTYMESQVFEDEQSHDMLDQTVTSHPHVMSAEVLTQSLPVDMDDLRLDLVEDQAIQKAYDAEIQLEIDRFCENTPLEPWRDAESGVEMSQPGFVHEALEPVAEPQIEQSEGPDLAEEGFIQAVDLANELDISEDSLMRILGHCKIRTSTGDVVDVGLGLEISQFLALWISPGLKECLESYLSHHLWVICLVDSASPQPDGCYSIAQVVPNPRLESRCLQPIQKFLQEIDRSQLHFMERRHETPDEAQLHPSEAVKGDRVCCIQEYPTYRAEWIGDVVNVAREHYQVQFLTVENPVWIKQDTAAKMPPIEGEKQGFAVQRTAPLAHQIGVMGSDLSGFPFGRANGQAEHHQPTELRLSDPVSPQMPKMTVSRLERPVSSLQSDEAWDEMLEMKNCDTVQEWTLTGSCFTSSTVSGGGFLSRGQITQ